MSRLKSVAAPPGTTSPTSKLVAKIARQNV
jgi:hypothetical protein